MILLDSGLMCKRLVNLGVPSVFPTLSQHRLRAKEEPPRGRASARPRCFLLSASFHGYSGYSFSPRSTGCLSAKSTQSTHQVCLPARESLVSLPRVFRHAVKERPIVVIGHGDQQHVVDPAPIKLEHAVPRQERSVGVGDAIAIVRLVLVVALHARAGGKVEAVAALRRAQGHERTPVLLDKPAVKDRLRLIHLEQEPRHRRLAQLDHPMFHCQPPLVHTCLDDSRCLIAPRLAAHGHRGAIRRLGCTQTGSRVRTRPPASARWRGVGAWVDLFLSINHALRKRLLKFSDCPNYNSVIRITLLEYCSQVILITRTQNEGSTKDGVPAIIEPLRKRKKRE